MSGGGLTILVAARNAEATIERAIASCLPERDAALVLIDDHSTDRTVSLARGVAGPRLRVVQASEPGGVGMARQTGLNAVDTELAAWLDADDEWIPGRAARLTQMLQDGADIATEGIELRDGPSGALLRPLPVPAFLHRPGGTLRLFERNFLPGDTQVVFRTSVFREVGGYDSALCGPESFDLLLRAVERGAVIAYSDSLGYRMYAYPGSVSRHLARQRAATSVALRKHAYERVRTLYRAAGFDDRIAAWALVMLAQFRDEPTKALEYLDAARPSDGDPTIVLEPDGPWPHAEGWRRAFHRGTLLLQIGLTAEATRELLRAESFQPTPEGANNLGVAYARLGRVREAETAFGDAVDRWPLYRDAASNAAQPAVAAHITTHPIRTTPSRIEYALADATR